MTDYQDTTYNQADQVSKPKRKEKSTQEKLERQLELRANALKQLEDLQKRIKGYDEKIEKLEVQARLEVIERYNMTPEEIEAALKQFRKEGD